MTRRPKSARPRPVVHTRTEAQYEQDVIDYAESQRNAARCTARWTIYRAHGCAARWRRLSPEGIWMDQVLMALGLIPDPVRPRRSDVKYRWGAVKGER